MTVLIGWSGLQARDCARLLVDWLPAILPASQPALVSEEFVSGPSFLEGLSSQLSESRGLVVCAAPERLAIPELHYQMGLLKGSWPRLSLYLFALGIDPEQLPDHFPRYCPAVFAKKESIRSWLGDLNRATGGHQREATLRGQFATAWPSLDAGLARLARQHRPGPYANGSSGQPPEVPPLSPEAGELLREAAWDPDGRVMKMSTLMGQFVQTNGRQFVEQNSPRSEAAWLGTIWELVKTGLLEPQGISGEVFRVTPEGYRVADRLR